MSNIYATLNPIDKASNVTLSGGDLTVGMSSTANGSVRANMGKTTGKWYYEVTINTIGSANDIYIGWGSPLATLTQYVGQNTNSYGFTDGWYRVWNGGFTSFGGSGNFANGTVVGVARDCDAGTNRFFINGVEKGSAYSASITGSGAFPMVSAKSTSNSLTVNFGASAMAYSPPSGYNAGIYEVDSGYTYSALDPANKSADIALSGGQLTAYEASSATWRTALSTISKTTGKYYWEYRVNSGSDNFVGVASATYNPTGNTLLGQQQYSSGYRQSSGAKSIYSGGWTIVGYGASFSTSDVIGCAVDFDAGSVSMYKNNTLQGVMDTFPANTEMFAAISAKGGAVTANFGNNPLVYSPPTGYNAGLYDGGVTPNTSAGFFMAFASS